MINSLLVWFSHIFDNCQLRLNLRSCFLPSCPRPWLPFPSLFPDSLTCSRYQPSIQSWQLWSSLTRGWRVSQVASQIVERGPRREERGFHGEPVLVPGEGGKGRWVLSRDWKQKKLIIFPCLFLTSVNFRLFWARTWSYFGDKIDGVSQDSFPDKMENCWHTLGRAYSHELLRETFIIIFIDQENGERFWNSYPKA